MTDMIKDIINGGNGGYTGPIQAAARTFISNLYVKRTTRALLKRLENGSSTCSLCLEEYGVNERVTTLPCEHMFHGDCIVKWLLRTDTCPLCRRKQYDQHHLQQNAQPRRWLLTQDELAQARLMFLWSRRVQLRSSLN